MRPNTESWHSMQTVGTAAALVLAAMGNLQSTAADPAVRTHIKPLSLSYTFGSSGSSVAFDSKAELNFVGPYILRGEDARSSLATDGTSEDDSAHMPIRQLKQVGTIKVQIKEIRRFKFPSLEA